jgi:hypothetical protein
MSKLKDQKPKLRPDLIYQGDNGRLFCGESRCAGASSYYTGRDISGQKVATYLPDDVAMFEEMLGKLPACEGCGKEASRIYRPEVIA